MTATGQTATGAGGRTADLDIFKTLLVWGMITAHCIQLLAVRPQPPAQLVSDTINLVTFSGFMLTFGYGIGLSRRSKSWGQRLWPVLLLLLATWTSEIAFNVLVEGEALTPDLLVPLLTLRRIYGWSEFLASFTTLYLIIAVARPALVAIASKGWTLTGATLLCLGSTLIVSNADVPLLATLVGTRNFASFPLLAYLPWFLIGIALARHPERPALPDWLLAAIVTGAFSWFAWQHGGKLPVRFPPSALWVAGAALPLLIYLMVARGLARLQLPTWLLQPGRHVLAALLLSNLSIFGLRWWQGYRLGAWWWTPILAVGLIALVTAWCGAIDALKGRSVGLAAPTNM